MNTLRKALAGLLMPSTVRSWNSRIVTSWKKASPEGLHVELNRFESEGWTIHSIHSTSPGAWRIVAYKDTPAVAGSKSSQRAR